MRVSRRFSELFFSGLIFRVIASAGFLLLAVSAPMEIHAEERVLRLSEAVICEGLEMRSPVRPGVVFPDALEKIYCYTHFSDVPQKAVVYHEWYSRDRLVAKAKLAVKPPKWSTYSSIQLRKADKGPWRVAITDAGGRVLKVLRFSITDGS